MNLLDNIWLLFEHFFDTADSLSVVRIYKLKPDILL